jgi:hypothetical protein
MNRKTVLFVLAFLALGTLPALADSIIYSGIDTWRTPDDGNSFTDYSSDPLPAGFFCAGSQPFTGRVEYKGVPLATGRPGALGQTDTIVHRLDNAELNARGVATTRIQVRALSMVNRAPIQTDCGAFNVKVSLDGRQPMTVMKIFRDGEEGGRFLAPLMLRVKLTFTPVGNNAAAPLVARRLVRLDADPRATWTSDESKRSVHQIGWINVDTDGDGTPDTYLPGTSNFLPGHSAFGGKAAGHFGHEVEEPLRS